MRKKDIEADRNIKICVQEIDVCERENKKNDYNKAYGNMEC